MDQGKHRAYVILLEFVVNILVIAETFFSVSNTEYFYPYDFDIRYLGHTCNFGNIHHDCFRPACKYLGEHPSLNATLFGECKKKPYFQSHNAAQLGITILTSIALALSFVVICIQAWTVFKNTMTSRVEFYMMGFQLVLTCLILCGYTIFKSIETHHIDMAGLRQAELAEMIVLIISMAIEIIVQINEIHLLRHRRSETAGLNQHELGVVTLKNIKENLYLVCRNYHKKFHKLLDRNHMDPLLLQHLSKFSDLELMMLFLMLEHDEKAITQVMQQCAEKDLAQYKAFLLEVHSSKKAKPHLREPEVNVE